MWWGAQEVLLACWSAQGAVGVLGSLLGFLTSPLWAGEGPALLSGTEDLSIPSEPFGV